MMPITDFLSCTDVLDEFESLSPPQRHHAKTYVTGLVAASNKTVTGIAREVLPARGHRGDDRESQLAETGTSIYGDGSSSISERSVLQ
jgi:hypothetical protein